MSEFDLLAAPADLKANCWVVRQVCERRGGSYFSCEMRVRIDDYDIDDIEHILRKQTHSLSTYCGVSSTTPKVLCTIRYTELLYTQTLACVMCITWIFFFGKNKTEEWRGWNIHKVNVKLHCWKKFDIQGDEMRKNARVNHGPVNELIWTKSESCFI